MINAAWLFAIIPACFVVVVIIGFLADKFAREPYDEYDEPYDDDF